MTREAGRPPVALTIAGSDPSGGAGIQADLKTFTALGVYGATIITALTAQSTRGVTAILSIPQEFIEQQIETLAADLRVSAVKTGMLGDRATVLTVVRALQRHDFGPVVVDPVMVATSGDVLLAPDAIDSVRYELIPRANLITPNLHEAAKLLDEGVATDVAGMESQGRRLLALGAKAVLIKGGHGHSAEAVDVLIEPGRITHHSAPRIATGNTHGTGCTLSAAITACLATGETDLAVAVGKGKVFISAALEAGKDLKIGDGRGPVDHLYKIKHHRD